MTYKSNYEPYTSQSLDIDRQRSPEEILYPLGSLYPHVVALQLQSDENPWAKARHLADYPDTCYWTDMSYPSTPEHFSSKPSGRRYSDSTAGRFVSRIRRFLSRDELRRRQRHA
ncbi:hypothetical protein BO82DRAFT_366538 [Aspergillus uvarum CBS 121591]|uniref:Uncharacterized protein n=4 Tax=Aspergillus TaxID=5052 RepID=A0A319CLZ5_9EURO|nr:uncharacterized protein ASPACDRAFT_79359 [Aspergillus aculeatus ATCC 16872]XP_025489883.1 hypothetical protein BO82DRAFT_366538 [Aspergillus uvarum CBS 121591]XP_040798076.1 uncharacterized protein BO72DRAFT_410907 [Aspergillus fijiensis CBS 313.89]PYI33759.1 hypothetical protein BP00DRAFT_444493 [Aspergillus indologenus CBS 114.80]OJJ99456.1 hypothetical protein ASPACDRAFT_79359 [Aspergillus aculeatus ATCC 16872]PYH79683.1 hypothetical protein BO82DRAFT_366538 [Aspergillus uvarum CBS 12159